MVDLRAEVSRRLARKEAPSRIRQELIDQGHAENDVEEALRNHVHSLGNLDIVHKRNNRLLSLHEALVRVGYGAAAPPFINILFFQSGAGLFLLGLFNGLKTVISMVLTALLQQYSRVHRVSKTAISAWGVVFGFSFFLMAYAAVAKHVWVFAIGILLAGIGVVMYGDLYNTFVSETIRREKRSTFLARMGQYGVLITMISMLLSGWLIDLFPRGSGETFLLWGMEFSPVGFLLSFEITAFAFILSGFLLSLLSEGREDRSYPLTKFIGEHVSMLQKQTKVFLNHKYLSLLLLATLITGVLEVLGQSYYALFMYQHFQYQVFGGYFNIAMLYSLAILASFLGPWTTRKVQHSIGMAPMLVFGTMLTAILPLALVFNPNIVAAGVGLMLSVLGAAIVGVAQGLLARKLLPDELRKKYFMSVGMLMFIPYLVLVPGGSWFAHAYGMESLFLLVAGGLVFIVMPLYFILVTRAHKMRL